MCIDALGGAYRLRFEVGFALIKDMLIRLGLGQKGLKIGKNIIHDRYVRRMLQVFVLSRVWWHDVLVF